MKLSIIIPFFNVEKYIRACVESVFRQGLDEDAFELILVNDGSTDNSMQVIEDIVSLHPNIILIHQQNKGLSVARNVGLSKSSGDYILFVDSDDLLVEGALKYVYQTIQSHDVEMLFVDYTSMTDEQIVTKLNCLKPLDAPISLWIGSGDSYVTHSFDYKCFVWRVIYKKEFLEKHMISFIPNICFEDIPFTTECLAHLKKCAKVNILLYVYRKRSGSIVNSIDIKKIGDMIFVLSFLIHFRNRKKYATAIKFEVTNLVFATFSDLLWYILSNNDLYEKRKIIVHDFRSLIPRFLLGNTPKQYLISLLFNFMPCKYIEIRRFIDVFVRHIKGKI